jgi:hypothetical protein
MLRIGSGLNGRIHRLRIYSRCLRTSEAVGNYRADPIKYEALTLSPRR